MSRTRRADWLRAGLELLRDEGEAALTIEAVCRRLGRTKGSFYHHFESLSAFHDALLAHWQDELTLQVIEAVEREPRARRRQRLAQLARSADSRLELAIQAWALRDPRAQAAVSAVDTRRIAYLEELWLAETGRRGRARLLARLDYASYLGAQRLFASLSSHSARELERALDQALLAYAADPAAAPE